MASALPGLKIEVAWGCPPANILLQNGASPPAVTWTDITDYVQLSAGVSFGRGRSAELDEVTAGQLSLVLKPAATTLVSQMRLRTPIRVSVKQPRTAAAWTVLWTGTVDDWGVGWDNGLRVLMPLRASDMVARLARKTLEAAPVQAILATNPVWCYPLDEDDGVLSAADRVGTNPKVPLLTWTVLGSPLDSETGKFGGLFSPGSPPLAAESTSAAFNPKADGTRGWFLSTGTSATFSFPDIGTQANGQTVQAFVYVAGTPTRKTSIIDLRGIFGADVALNLTSAGKVEAALSSFGTPIATVTSSATIVAKEWHHVALTQTATGGTGTLKLYVDGVSAGTATWSGSVVPAGSFEAECGAFSAGDLFFGNIANVAAHDRALSASEIADIAGTRNGADGQGAVARAYALARWAGLSAKTPTAPNLGDSAMQPQAVKGSTLAQALSTCATAEMAPWFVDRTGVLVMNNRADQYSPAPQFDLPARAVTQDTQFATTDQFLINKVTATRPGGTSPAITVKDEPSISAYETYETTVEALLTTDAAMSDYAQAMLNRYKEPQPRSDSVGVYVTATAADLDATVAGTSGKIAAAEIGQAFTVSGLPSEAPASTLTFVIEGIQDQFNVQGWTRTFNVSAAQTSASWLLGNSSYSLLGSTTVLAF